MKIAKFAETFGCGRKAGGRGHPNFEKNLSKLWSGPTPASTSLVISHHLRARRMGCKRLDMALQEEQEERGQEQGEARPERRGSRCDQDPHTKSHTKLKITGERTRTATLTLTLTVMARKNSEQQEHGEEDSTVRFLFVAPLQSADLCATAG